MSVISGLIALALVPLVAEANPRIARLYLAYAYEWNGYRCSENVPGDTARLIRPHTVMTTPMSLQRLDLGVVNTSPLVLREARLTLDLPTTVRASPHASATWIRDGEVPGRWAARIGDLGAGLMRLASPTGPLLLEITGVGPINVSYAVSTTNQGPVTGTFAVQRAPLRTPEEGC